MGLDTTHDGFHGAYSAFNRLRQAVCKAAGGRYPHFDEDDRLYLRDVLKIDNPVDGFAGSMWYVPDDVTREAWPGLYLFLEHSDCDGEISPADCTLVANDLEKLLPAVDAQGGGGGHIESQGGYGAVLRKFIAGCRLAAGRGEVLEFH